MKLRALGLGVSLALIASGAMAQPTTKLATGIDSATLATVWCSALFFEESFWYDEGTDWAVYFEDLAYELDDEVHGELVAAGLGEAEIEELWSVHDEAAQALAEGDEEAYLAQLDPCRSQYGSRIPQPKRQ